MVLGDELDVFGVVDYFTHTSLMRGGIEIKTAARARTCRTTCSRNGSPSSIPTRAPDRTRPAERQMFYRQVFNYGNGPVTDDVMLNAEFGRLWKVLMLESARVPGARAGQPESRQLRVTPERDPGGRGPAVQPLDPLHGHGHRDHADDLRGAGFRPPPHLMHPEVMRQIVPGGRHAGGRWSRSSSTPR